jgi:hypothetical protein
LAAVALAAGVLAWPALANDREARFRRIASEYQLQAEAVSNEARRRNAPHAGSMFNEFGIPEFFCGSLAFLLGKDEIFERLTKLSAPDFKPHMSEIELNNLALDAIQFGNRAHAAGTALAMSQRERVEVWNLNCVRQHKIGAEHAVARAATAATFEVRANGVYILGDIEVGFFDRFRAFMKGRQHTGTVFLGSGGGSVRDALMTGYFIRDAGLSTSLYADCYSACPLIFLGGIDRYVWSPYPRLGFHQASADGTAIPLNHELYSLIRNYAQRMGADGSRVVSLMHRSSPQELNYPEVRDLCDLGLATWVQRGCSSPVGSLR